MCILPVSEDRFDQTKTITAPVKLYIILHQQKGFRSENGIESILLE